MGASDVLPRCAPTMAGSTATSGRTDHQYPKTVLKVRIMTRAICRFINVLFRNDDPLVIPAMTIMVESVKTNCHISIKAMVHVHLCRSTGFTLSLDSLYIQRILAICSTRIMIVSVRSKVDTTAIFLRAMSVLFKRLTHTSVIVAIASPSTVT